LEPHFFKSFSQGPAIPFPSFMIKRPRMKTLLRVLKFPPDPLSVFFSFLIGHQVTSPPLSFTFYVFNVPFGPFICKFLFLYRGFLFPRPSDRFFDFFKSLDFFFPLFEYSLLELLPGVCFGLIAPSYDSLTHFGFLRCVGRPRLSPALIPSILTPPMIFFPFFRRTFLSSALFLGVRRFNSLFPDPFRTPLLSP